MDHLDLPAAQPLATALDDTIASNPDFADCARQAPNKALSWWAALLGEEGVSVEFWQVSLPGIHSKKAKAARFCCIDIQGAWVALIPDGHIKGASANDRWGAGSGAGGAGGAASPADCTIHARARSYCPRASHLTQD